jgi:glycerol-3-phosphate dehydrogenase
MNVAVIGGGINGVMSAWSRALNGCSVDLFERDSLMCATSSASTKLLHGGLRYLEHGHLRFVREALHERRWWMSRAPHLTNRLQINVPVYEDSRRPEWKFRCGLQVYNWLAGRASLGQWQRRSPEDMLRCRSDLRSQGLRAVFTFFDGQMDDHALGLWAAEKAECAGVRIHTGATVNAISPEGDVYIGGSPNRFDKVVNAAGPWARQLLDDSSVSARHDLDLVRGSHIVLAQSCESAFLLQSPRDGRICFVLPYQGKTLVGTTEVRHDLSDPIRCSPEEASYLLELYNHYFPSRDPKICNIFSGLRPLIRSHADPTKSKREYVIEKNRRVISVFGGKWTTSRILGLKVAEACLS